MAKMKHGKIGNSHRVAAAAEFIYGAMEFQKVKNGRVSESMGRPTSLEKGLAIEC